MGAACWVRWEEARVGRALLSCEEGGAWESKEREGASDAGGKEGRGEGARARAEEEEGECRDME